MPDVQLTWLGHGAFRFDTPGGKRVYLDPFLDNPKCPEDEKEPERIDILALTHGHDDHVGSSVELIKQFKPTVVGIVELLGWLEGQGAEVGEMPGTNKGGTRDVDGVKFTMTDARHSSGGPERRVPRASRPASWSRPRTGRSSTSPATRQSSATCS